MKLSKAGLKLIKEFEGLRLEAYTDTAGVRTIGYGHAYYTGKSPITITEAEALLKKDVEKFEKKVQDYDDVYDWTQNEFDAMVSFCYNVGTIRELTKGGTRTKAEIAEKMLQYVKSGGNRIKGLEERRKKECQLFLSHTAERTHQDEIFAACHVVLGKYGNQPERQKKLESEGFNYQNVRKLVNAILKL